MKHLELNLKKKVLLIDIVDAMLLIPFKKENKAYIYFNGHKWKLIGKLCELKEEDFVELAEIKRISFGKISFYDYKNMGIYSKSDAKSSFESAIQAQGLYLENPYGKYGPELESVCCNHWIPSNRNPNEPACCEQPEPSDSSLEMLQLWEEAESKTFNPEQTYLFEILN